MKTTNTTSAFSKKTKKRIIATLIGKKMVYLLALLFITPLLRSQPGVKPLKTTIGLSLFSQVSANGYGGTTIPMAYLKKGLRSYLVGPVVQNCRLNISGFQFNYTYSLTGPGTPGYCS